MIKKRVYTKESQEYVKKYCKENYIRIEFKIKKDIKCNKFLKENETINGKAKKLFLEWYNSQIKNIC